MEMQGKDYYDYGLQKGCDLNFYGDWQRNYAKMLIDISSITKLVANNQKSSVFLDCGTACGLIPRAIRELKMFKSVFGFDKNDYLITLGKETHGFNNDEDENNQLFVHDLENIELPFENNCIFLIHASQVLEHVHSDKLSSVFKEWNRILHPEGRIIISVPTISAERVKERKKTGAPHDDPTHISMNTKLWWMGKIKKHLKIDTNVEKKFKKTKHTVSNPIEESKTFYDVYGKSWTIFGLQKKG